MGFDMAITEAQVHAIAARLDGEGRKVTAVAVRDALGAGSYTTIQKYLRTYDGEPMSEVSEIPCDLLPIFQGVWGRAVQLAHDRANVEIAAATVERDALLGERGELLALLDAKEKECAKLQKALEKAEKNNERLLKILESLKQ